MKIFKKYVPPLVEIVMIEEDVVRTSLGGDDGELPVQPWFFE